MAEFKLKQPNQPNGAGAVFLQGKRRSKQKRLSPFIIFQVNELIDCRHIINPCRHNSLIHYDDIDTQNMKYAFALSLLTAVAAQEPAQESAVAPVEVEVRD